MFMSFILGLTSILTIPLALVEAAFPDASIPLVNRIIELLGGTGDHTYESALEFINYFKNGLPMFKDTLSELIEVIFDKIV